MPQMQEIQLIGPPNELTGEQTATAWRFQPQCPECFWPVKLPKNRYEFMATCDHCGAKLTIRALLIEVGDDSLRAAVSGTNTMTIEPQPQAETPAETEPAQESA